MALTVNKLHTHFFAEVSGVDLTSSFSDDTLVEILEAFSQHSVLLFRDQDFDDVSQIQFSKRIGPLEKNVTATFGKPVINGIQSDIVLSL